MTVPHATLEAIRGALAALHADTDSHGVHAPTLDEIFAPARHRTALDPATAIVKGARGSGKSFWSGVLFDPDLRAAAALAYPGLGLERARVAFGFSGLAGPQGIDRDCLDDLLGTSPTPRDARNAWWATVLRATWAADPPPWTELMALAQNLDARAARLSACASALGNQTLLVVYDALDAVATDWDRRRLLTDALLEVAWTLKGWRGIRPKLFVRSDQLDDDGLRFVELSKIRQRAVPLAWAPTDLYGMLFARLALGSAAADFGELLHDAGQIAPTREDVLTRRWAPSHDAEAQRRVMERLAGAYMAPGPHGYKRGRTYDWSLNHLADGAAEVSPRSFVALFVGAARTGSRPPATVFGAEGMKQGLREAYQIRVAQLQLEFRWLTAVLTPLAGVRLPLADGDLAAIWQRERTVASILKDSQSKGYMPPFPGTGAEPELLAALIRINVMVRRTDGRVDMPPLFETILPSVVTETEMASPPTSLVPTVTYPAIVGQVLATLRASHELSQAELASVAGLKQAAWSKIERGQTALNVEQLMQIAQAFGLKPWQILKAADDAAQHVVDEGVKVEPTRVHPVAAGAVLISTAALGGLVGAGHLAAGTAFAYNAAAKAAAKETP